MVSGQESVFPNPDDNKSKYTITKWSRRNQRTITIDKKGALLNMDDNQKDAIKDMDEIDLHFLTNIYVRAGKVKDLLSVHLCMQCKNYLSAKVVEHFGLREIHNERPTGQINLLSRRRTYSDTSRDIDGFDNLKKLLESESFANTFLSSPVGSGIIDNLLHVGFCV